MGIHLEEDKMNRESIKNLDVRNKAITILQKYTGDHIYNVRVRYCTETSYPLKKKRRKWTRKEQTLIEKIRDVNRVFRRIN